MPGTRTTIYIDDELLGNARRLEINVSDVCQRALAAEIDLRISTLEQAINAGESARNLLRALQTLDSERVSVPATQQAGSPALDGEPVLSS